MHYVLFNKKMGVVHIDASFQATPITKTKEATIEEEYLWHTL